MRSRISLFVILFLAGSLALPMVAQAGGIPFFGPIIEKAWMQCPLGWGALITVINNIISLLITLAIVFVAPMMIAWAGFLMVFSPTKVGDVSKAKSILLNTVIGIVIALAGWMIVDAIMAVLYNANASNERGGVLGTWSSLIGSGGLPPCIDLKGSVAPTVAPPPAVGVVPTTDRQLASRINAFQRAAATAGLSAVYEVPNESERLKVINAGVTGQVLVVSGVAPHFSVYGSGGSGGRVSDTLKSNPQCTTCVPITGISCKSSASCSVASSFVNLLRNIPTNESSIGTWLVTEAFPPTVSHASACHYTGTCIDAAFR